MAKSFKEFIVKENLHSYLVTYLPSPPIDWELTDYDSDIAPSCSMYRFSSRMLDNFEPIKLYSELESHLLNILESEKAEIRLPVQYHQDFIFLLFHYQSLFTHVTREYRTEISNIKLIKELVHMKILLRESKTTSTDLSVDYSKKLPKINIPNISRFDIAVDALLNHYYNFLIEDYSDIKLELILFPDTALDDLKVIWDSFGQIKNYKHILTALASHFLGKYLNDHAEHNLPRAKRNLTFTSHHIRFLIPFYETLKWRHFHKKLDIKTGRLTYKNSIKSFRSHVDELQ